MRIRDAHDIPVVLEDQDMLDVIMRSEFGVLLLPYF